MFILICVAMVAAALALIARPLLKLRAANPTLIGIVAFVSIAAASTYYAIGHRTWEKDEGLARTAATSQQDLAANIARLERQVREHPEDVDSTLTLAEALIQQDERAIAGRAGELFEQALSRAPDNAKALWYGAISSLANGQLPTARERLQRILVQNPPDNIKSIIERQIQDIGQQLGEKSAAASNAKAIDVQVEVKSDLLKGLDQKTALFVLAREPGKGGPPLAVTRRVVGDLPLKVSLSDNDAMMPGRGISTVPRVEVVARISKSGTPQAQPGDIEGSVSVDVPTTQSVAVKIVIDRKITQ